jgi:hypothetical protein
MSFKRNEDMIFVQQLFKAKANIAKPFHFKKMLPKSEKRSPTNTTFGA